MALGLAQGISAGLEDIDRREQRRIDMARQQEADEMRREEFGLRRRELARQDAEYARQQAARQELGDIAERSYRDVETASPYVGDSRQSLDDPEFGLEAAGAPSSGLGLQSVKKDRRFDQDAYNEGVYQWLTKNDPAKALEFRKAIESLRTDEAKGFIRSVMAGDIAGAERYGSDRIRPGTLKVDNERGIASGIDLNGRPFEIDINMMARAAGVGGGTEAGKVLAVDPGMDIVDPRTGGLIRRGDPSRSPRSGGSNTPAEIQMMDRLIRGGVAKDDSEALKILRTLKEKPRNAAILDLASKLMTSYMAKTPEEARLEATKMYDAIYEGEARSSAGSAGINETYKHPSGKVFTKADIEARARKEGVTPQEIINKYGLQ